jgi:hypothetical protein
MGASLNTVNLVEGYVHPLGEKGFLKPEIKGILFQQINLESIPAGIIKDEEDYLCILTLYDTEFHIAKTCSPTR